MTEASETEDEVANPAIELAAKFGISKARLYSIADGLEAAGFKDQARDLRAAADYLDELMGLPDAYDAFMEVMVEWGRQNGPRDDEPGSDD